MHAHEQSNNGNAVGRLGGGSAGRPIPGPQRQLIELLAEQGAVPFDQLQRFLRCKGPQLEGRLRALQRLGWIEQRRFLVGDTRWFWLSRRGAGIADGTHRYTVPNVRSLPHRRAINETRLFLREREPAGRWISERVIHAADPSAEHVPDGVFEIGGERHAIEVELSRKPPRTLAEILDQHSSRYDAVIYMCGARTYGLMERLQGEGRWPTLRVQRLPARGSTC